MFVQWITNKQTRQENWNNNNNNFVNVFKKKKLPKLFGIIFLLNYLTLIISLFMCIIGLIEMSTVGKYCVEFEEYQWITNKQTRQNILNNNFVNVFKRKKPPKLFGTIFLPSTTWLLMNYLTLIISIFIFYGPW